MEGPSAGDLDPGVGDHAWVEASAAPGPCGWGSPRSADRTPRTLGIGLPDVAGVEMAASYRPAGDVGAAGGDFAEVVDLEGVVGIVIGDVIGHGVDAAVCSLQVRSDLATALYLTRDPVAALCVADHRARGRAQPYVGTAMCLVVDPARRVAAIATAGHPSPLVVSDDRTSEWLDVRAGAPLGMGGDRPAATALPLGGDDVVLCFTDGVVERPGVLLDHGVAHLAGRVGACDVRAVADVVDAAMEASAVFTDGRDDAVALAFHVAR